MNKRALITIGVVLITGIPIYIYLSQVSYQLKEGSRIARQAFDPTTEAGMATSLSRARTKEEYEHWDRGDEYMKQGRYDLAISEYTLVNKYGRMEWESRTLLSKAYEKAGQNDQALLQLDWLIARNPRGEILKGFVERRNALLQTANQTKSEG